MNASDSLPALLGGPAIRPEGPPAWPLPDEDVRAALLAAYLNGSWGKYHGPNVEELERRLEAYHGTAHALTCGSGTFAVELALRALRIGPGDEVILAAYDFPGNFLSIHAVGATPVLVDIQPDNWNLDPGSLKPAISSATKAMLVSHLHGGVVPMRDVMLLAASHNIAVIEDAAQMPGATIQGKKAGTWGDVGMLSFGGSKLLTAGRGGAIITNRADIQQRAKVANFRGNVVCPISELQAAVLLPQLDKLSERNEERAKSVERLKLELRDLPGLRCFTNDSLESVPGYYKLGFQYDPEQFGLPRERFVASMRAEGIAFDEGFRAHHVGRSPSRYRSAGALTEAERAHHGCVILHHPVLLGCESDILQVAAAIQKIHANAERLR